MQLLQNWRDSNYGLFTKINMLHKLVVMLYMQFLYLLFHKLDCFRENVFLNPV